jgi:hypothetical protein
MPDVLSREDLKFWDENGYVIVREAISKQQAREAENAVWEFLGMNPQDARSWYEKPIGKGIMMEFYHHPALIENRKSKRIRKAFAQSGILAISGRPLTGQALIRRKPMLFLFRDRICTGV